MVLKNPEDKSMLPSKVSTRSSSETEEEVFAMIQISKDLRPFKKELKLSKLDNNDHDLYSHICPTYFIYLWSSHFRSFLLFYLLLIFISIQVITKIQQQTYSSKINNPKLGTSFFMQCHLDLAFNQFLIIIKELMICINEHSSDISLH